MKKLVSAGLLIIVLVAGFVGWRMFGPAPIGTDLSRSRTTEAGLYIVSIAPENEPFNRNDMHSWIVEIKDKAGQPVQGAKLAVGGGMPRHGHGLPTAPEMTDDLGGGKYRVDGVRFHMFGWWEFSFDIDAAPGKDRVVFNLQL
jgi:hypothetical protein